MNLGVLIVAIPARLAVIWRRLLGGCHRERLRAVEALRDSEQRYRALYDNIGVGVSLISPELKVLSLNRRMKQWFPEVVASQCPLCYEAFNSPPRTEPCNDCPTKKTLADGQVHEGVTEKPTANGVRCYRIVSTPLTDPAGRIIAAVEMVDDITDRKRAEAERVVLDEQLRQAQKMESVGQLAGGVAHDFNNILTGISGYAELALERLDTASPMREDLAEVLRLSKRAAQLTRQLLAFSRRQTLEPQVLNLNDMVARRRQDAQARCWARTLTSISRRRRTSATSGPTRCRWSRSS